MRGLLQARQGAGEALTNWDLEGESWRPTSPALSVALSEGEGRSRPLCSRSVSPVSPLCLEWCQATLCLASVEHYDDSTQLSMFMVNSGEAKLCELRLSLDQASSTAHRQTSTDGHGERERGGETEREIEIDR